MYYTLYTVFPQYNIGHFRITILSASCRISHALSHNNEQNLLAAKRHGPAFQAAIFEELWFDRYDSTERRCTVHSNFSLPDSCTLLIIDHACVLIYSLPRIFINIFLFYIVATITCLIFTQKIKIFFLQVL
jgi:hypothetical protein